MLAPGWHLYRVHGLLFLRVASWLHHGCHSSGHHLHCRGRKKEVRWHLLCVSFLPFFFIKKV